MTHLLLRLSSSGSGRLFRRGLFVILLRSHREKCLRAEEVEEGRLAGGGPVRRLQARGGQGARSEAVGHEATRLTVLRRSALRKWLASLAG